MVVWNNYNIDKYKDNNVKRIVSTIDAQNLSQPYMRKDKNLIMNNAESLYNKKFTTPNKIAIKANNSGVINSNIRSQTAQK